MRDANRGGCSQSCRWKYDLYDMPFGKERKSLQGEIPEEFSMSAVDMSMIDHISDMIENGVDSLIKQRSDVLDILKKINKQKTLYYFVV
ncbi:Peptidase_U32 domain protein [Streptococcus pneumoniae]|nr:Peptidase_U32 domain protein [Streptococcus pneumoniae]